MIPTSPPNFHGSVGEERVFRSLRSLADDVVVIHSFRWLHPGNASLLTRHLKAQGEGDFVLFDPARGVMVVEVKGGEVWCEGGEWWQRNRRTGHVQPIYYPDAQASDTAYRIGPEVIEKVPEAEKLLYCHAVWFPDGAIDRSNLPMNLHRDTTFDAEDVAQPAQAIKRAFDYWASRFPGRRGVSEDIAHKVVNVLAPSFSIVRSVRQTLDEREEFFIRLTQDQARVVEFLDEQLHAAILGAAGTGKTLLAVEKARRLASPTRPVLFLCFNAGLRQHLHAHHAHPNVRYLTFHGLARELMGPEGSLEQAEEDLIDHLLGDGNLPGEHLIVDEGQDFKRDWLEALQLRFQNKAFYVFYDRYQVIQGEMDTRWLDQIPCRLVLTRNCRNTDPIARVAYRAGGLPVVPTLGLRGPRPVLHVVADSAAATKVVSALVELACVKHKVPPYEIAILTLETLDEASSWRFAKIGGHYTNDQPKTDCITVTTVRRFKGLEASLIVVVDVDFRRAVDDEWRRRLYVACSRARHAVHIVTTTKETDLGGALRAFAGSEKVRASWRALSRQLGTRLAEGENLDPFNEPRSG